MNNRSKTTTTNEFADDIRTVDILGEEFEIRQVQSTEMFEAMNRSEIDIQIATARKFPRSIAQALKRIEERACLNQEVAQSCTYSLKRGSSRISGPSVRMAEIVAACWGNLRTQARVVDEGARFVTAQGLCHDLETNNSMVIEAKRRITDKHGRRYNDDMLMMTANAAASIALRNAVFRVVPRAEWDDVYKKILVVAAGKGQTFEKQRAVAFANFEKLGVTPKQLIAALNRGGAEDITIEDIVEVRGWWKEIHEGNMSVADITGMGSNKLTKGNSQQSAPAISEIDLPPEEAPIDAECDGALHDMRLG